MSMRSGIQVCWATATIAALAALAGCSSDSSQEDVPETSQSPYVYDAAASASRNASSGSTTDAAAREASTYFDASAPAFDASFLADASFGRAAPTGDGAGGQLQGPGGQPHDAALHGCSDGGQMTSVDFDAICSPPGTLRWTDFEWEAVFPSPTNGSAIVFSAQTAPSSGGSFVPATPVWLATATFGTVIISGTFDAGGYDSVLIDTPSGGMGKFTTAMPPVQSQPALRIFINVVPTADCSASPMLAGWHVNYTCSP